VNVTVRWSMGLAMRRADPTSARQTQPWREAGVSRATWYRRSRPERVRSLLLRFSSAQRLELRRLLDNLDGSGDREAR
jgi:hypothetical protein